VAGLTISAALARVVANLLFGVPALDPWTYAGTSLVLLLIAALACLIPARRAAWRNE
jgi:putative ABC transport system permease protein